MRPQEYFAFLPLLIYGFAIAELISPWRSFFEGKRPYYPFILTGLLLLEGAFFNFYQFYAHLEGTYQSYHIFLSYLITPLIFLVTSHVFTPDQIQRLDTKAYFESRFRLLMILIATFLVSHYIYDNVWNLLSLFRGFFIVLFLTAAWTRKIWIVYVIFLLRVVLIVFNII